MTLKQQEILGVQVEMCRALIWHEEQYDEAVPFSKFGDSNTSLDTTALRRLVKAKLVLKTQAPNIHGGYHTGYRITPEGRAWYDKNAALFHSLTTK